MSEIQSNNAYRRIFFLTAKRRWNETNYFILSNNNIDNGKKRFFCNFSKQGQLSTIEALFSATFIYYQNFQAANNKGILPKINFKSFLFTIKFLLMLFFCFWICSEQRRGRIIACWRRNMLMLVRFVGLLNNVWIFMQLLLVINLLLFVKLCFY